VLVALTIGIVGLPNVGKSTLFKFLATTREADAICRVIRTFVDPDVVHVDGKVDPASDIGPLEGGRS
jgi:ribosome-binding ATPase